MSERYGMLTDEPQPIDLLRPVLQGRVGLLLEDEKFFFEPILQILSHYGFARVDHFVVGEAARDAGLTRNYDILILDRVNSGLDGLQVLRAIRAGKGTSADAPALMVTSLNQEWQRIDGLLGGADDYVAKPVAELELVARIASQLRRVRRDGVSNAAPDAKVAMVNGPLTINESTRSAALFGEVLNLTAQSYTVLLQMMRERGQPLTKTMLFQRCWPNWAILPDGWENTIYKAIDRLRTALEPLEQRLPTACRPIIMNLRGQGYVLRDLSDISVE